MKQQHPPGAPIFREKGAKEEEPQGTLGRCHPPHATKDLFDHFSDSAPQIGESNPKSTDCSSSLEDKLMGLKRSLSTRPTDPQCPELRARPAVQTRTAWNAPIMWELMFDANLYDQRHKNANTSVAMTVFAVGRYLDAYLHKFLYTAENHFMLGLPVTYYVFTDLPEQVSLNFTLGPHRNLKVVRVNRYSRWQDISMMRMRTISEIIENELQNRFTYVFCFDVDQEFKARFGSEALGDSVAMVHAHYYKLPKERFTYDRNPKSKAYMDQGDYYYHAAIFGGTCENVKALTDFCYLNIMEDKINNVEALWHDESHLNKYFWLHKPTKLLSPEYCWDLIIPDESDILIKRLLWAPKEYEKVRT